VRIITADELMKIWASFGGPEKRQLFERIYNRTAERYGATIVRAYDRQWYEIDLGTEDLRYASRRPDVNNWVKRAFVKEASEWEGISPVDRRPIWQSALDAYVEEFRNEGDLSDDEIIQKFIQHARSKMSPGYEPRVRAYAAEKFNIVPGEPAMDAGYAVDDVNAIPGYSAAQDQSIRLTTHLDRFFDVMRRESPELQGPEFETANEGWEQEENNRLIFAEWMRNAVHDLPFLFDETGELTPQAREAVKQHVIQTQGFDPFDDEQGEGAELEPRDPDESDDTGDVSLEALNNMFSDSVYDPGAAEERHRSRTDEEDVQPPSPAELEQWWR
jgi:hypothetical protein